MNVEVGKSDFMEKSCVPMRFGERVSVCDETARTAAVLPKATYSPVV